MGGSSVSCAQQKLASPEIYLECYSGQMNDKDFKFGIMANDITNSIYCTEEAIWADTANKDRFNCTDHMDIDAMRQSIVDQCSGKPNCTVQTSTWYNSNTPSDIHLETGVCGDDATFYLQAACLIPEKEASIRKIFGLVCGCLCVFVYLFVIIYFDYVKSVQKCKFVDQDVNTITAGDYSVEFDLEEKTYTNF